MPALERECILHPEAPTPWYCVIPGQPCLRKLPYPCKHLSVAPLLGHLRVFWSAFLVLWSSVAPSKFCCLHTATQTILPAQWRLNPPHPPPPHTHTFPRVAWSDPCLVDATKWSQLSPQTELQGSRSQSGSLSTALQTRGQLSPDAKGCLHPHFPCS